MFYCCFKLWQLTVLWYILFPECKCLDFTLFNTLLLLMELVLHMFSFILILLILNKKNTHTNDGRADRGWKKFRWHFLSVFVQAISMTKWIQCQIQGRGRGARPPLPPYFWTKLRPKGPKKIFFKTRPPLSQGLDDRALPLSEGLDLPLEYNNVPPLNGVSQSENALNGIYQR